MKTTRRQFMGLAGKGLAATVLAVSASGLLYPKVRGAEPRPGEFGWAEHWSEHAWAFGVDTTRCIGCGRCIMACKQENGLVMAPEYTRTWVERYVITADREVFVDAPFSGMYGFQGEAANLKYKNVALSKSFFVPKLCNQCEKPPCVQVCPVAATYKTGDGVILVDQERCIGCGYCVQACPYGARYLDPRLRVADKCTWCYHRISQGLLPACVQVCPVQARVFGDLRDPESAISRLLRENRVSVLKPALGTKPKVFYVGIEAEVM